MGTADGSWHRAMLAALAETLVRGRWWLLALAAFLVRGGLLLVLPAILVLPTPAELATLLSPSIAGTGLSHPTPALIAILAITSLSLLAIVLLTTTIGTWLDVSLIDAMVDDAPRLPLSTAIEARLVAHVPTAIAIALAVGAFGDATMAELTSPSGSGPLVIRILARAPLATVAILVAWFVGETWGGVAIRRLAATSSLSAALLRGLADLVRPSGIATFGLTTVVVAVPLATLWLTAGRAFDRLWPFLAEPWDERIVAIGLGLLVATWGAGLWLVGIALAFRSAAWTAEVERRR